MKSQKAKEFIDGCMAHLTVEMSDHAKWQLRAAMTHAAELAEQEMEGFYTCWFDKDNPDTVFMDCRSEEHTLCDGRRLEIRPDVVGDFRKMPFPDNSFYLVLFDPPHLNNLGESSWLAKKYGRLLPSWEDDIRQGFEECMRVLKPNGTLIFKWNEQQIPTARIIEIIGQKPLFGHTSGKGGKTIWMCFLKNEKSNETHL